MANRRSYGNNSGGGNYNQGNRYQGGGGGGGGVNPWQAGTSPGRGGGIPSLFNQNLLNQLASPDSQLAIATKLLSSILPAAAAQAQGAPPSLLSMGGGYGPGPNRFNSGGGGGGNFPTRFRRDDRQGGNRGGNDQFNKNRRQQNDRNGRKGRNNGQKQKDNKNAAANKASQQAKKATPAKAAPVEAKPANEQPAEDEKMDTEEPKEKGNEEPLEEYVGIPSKLLHCHVCGKSMWNDVSFDTHVKGRNHLQKMRELEESYQMQTNLMRQIAAISLKLEEVRRGKRRPYPEQYCKMCDLNFNGMTMFAHRSTEEHQGLKRFIHPTCTLCNADFKARLEYDEHILTPQHLQLEAKQQARKELYDKDPKYVQLRQEEAKFRFQLEELSALGQATTGVKLNEDDKKTVEDLGLPAWDPDVEYAAVTDQVVPVEGYLCKVCKVFVLSKETAELHARTQKHYEVFIARALDRVNKKKDKDDDKRKNSTNDDESDAKRLKMEGEAEPAEKEEWDIEGETSVNGTAEGAADGDAEAYVDASIEAEATPKEKTPPAQPSTPTPAATAATTPKSVSPRRSVARRGRGRGRK